MSLAERLEADMKDALRSRDAIRLETIRGIRGAVRNREIEIGEALDEAAIQRVIRSLVKQRADAIEQYRAAGREELAQKEESERAVLEAYLPKAPDSGEIESALRAVIEEVGAQGMKDLGRVIKPTLERLGPAAEGKQVSELARKLLG